VVVVRVRFLPPRFDRHLRRLGRDQAVAAADGVAAADLPDLPAIADDDRGRRLTAPRADGFDLLHHVVPRHDLAEHDVLAVEVGRRGRAEEELRAVRVRTGVRHRQGAGAEVLARLAAERFVVEAAAVDRLAAAAVAAGEVAPLAHEVGDHAVERRALERERRSRLALRADAQLEEVFGGLGARVGEQFHLDPPGRLAADGDVEEHRGVLRVHGVERLVRVGHGGTWC
jgi:hypothetical protein